MPQGPAYSILTERLIVRALEPRDAAVLAQLIADNARHLRPWIEWAREGPRTLDATLDTVRRMRGRFDLGEAYAFALLRRSDEVMIGGAALSPDPADESAALGYWLASASTGQGFATEAVCALVRVAFEIEHATFLEIHTAPDNQKSSAVAARAGFKSDGTLRARLRSEDGSRSPREYWSMLRDEYPASAAAKVPVTAHDAIGRVLLDGASTSSRRSALR
ncbi:MAG: GNAT family N-acetyltransferase [Planctomycetes bacterium]|nr:GNAT family N-acetyltransferase [Planctomycetota bacterium]